MIVIGEPKVNARQTEGTILDNSIVSRIAIDITKTIPGGVRVGDATTINSIRLPRGLRTGLVRDPQGNLILSPIVRAFDSVVDAVISGNGAKVRDATGRFFRVWCDEIRRELIHISKPRNGRSAMLIGICGYRDDMFSGNNYLDGRLSDLKPWQVGLADETIHKLGVTEGEVVIFSRFPTTMVIPMEVVTMDIGPSVVALPANNCLRGDRETSAAKETGGDKDGDAYTVRTVHSDKARAELWQAFHKFWDGVTEQPLDRTGYTWNEHEPRHCDPERTALEKFLQKSAVGSTTLDWYAVFGALMNARRRGVATDLTFEDVRKSMMEAFEATFDLKHGNGANPMTLHSLLLGMTSIEDSSETLMKQGVDLSTIAKIIDLTGGANVRDAAMANPAYAIAFGQRDRSDKAIELLIRKTPADKTLAETFRRCLFPFDYDTGGAR
jgi:hypothetical protein